LSGLLVKLLSVTSRHRVYRNVEGREAGRGGRLRWRKPAGHALPQW